MKHNERNVIWLRRGVVVISAELAVGGCFMLNHVNWLGRVTPAGRTAARRMTIGRNGEASVCDNCVTRRESG